MYDTKEEAHQKLVACLCLFNGEPAYIENAHGNENNVVLEFWNTRSKITDMQPIKHDGWEFRELGPRVGYMNINRGEKSHKEAVYTVRSAVRIAHNTQCLSYKNMKLKTLRGAPHLGLEPFQLEWQAVVKSDWAADMVEGKYPTLQGVRETFMKDPFQTSMAFTRELAVFRHEIGPYYIEYKGKQIGYSDDMEDWKVGDKYKYLIESLEHNSLKVKYGTY